MQLAQISMHLRTNFNESVDLEDGAKNDAKKNRVLRIEQKQSSTVPISPRVPVHGEIQHVTWMLPGASWDIRLSANAWLIVPWSGSACALTSH